MAVSILHTRDGKLDDADKAQLDALRSRIKTGNPKIILHLHGGLVNEASGVAAATRLSALGAHAFNVPPDWEQIYVIWRTGAMETLRTNWKDIFQNDRLYRTLLKKLISLVSSKIMPEAAPGRSIHSEMGLTPAEVERRLLSGSDQPFADADTLTIAEDGSKRAVAIPADDEDIESDFQNELESDEKLNEVAADVEAALMKDAPQSARSFVSGDAVSGQKTLAYVDDRVTAPWMVEKATGRALIGGSVLIGLAKHGAKIGLRVIRRYRAGRDHGLHATVVEEVIRELYGDLIGSIVWGMMKQDAEDHFATGALGDVLLDVLALNPTRRLLLSGHSAGSIWASELLLASNRRGIAMPLDLVLLAPAVRTAKFAEALAAKQGDIGAFRLFAMSDALERSDVLLGKGYGFLYPSSLLYFVSGLCEDAKKDALADAPLLGMQRFIECKTNWTDDTDEGAALKRVRTFLSADAKRTVFSIAARGAGLDCQAQSHGAFDDDPKTLQSVATLFE